MSASPDLRTELGEDFDRRHWKPWQYNEIVGYVELRLLDNKLKAYYWFVDAHRLRVDLRKKTIRYIGKLIDVSDDVDEKDNSEIAADIRKFFLELPKLRNRFRKLYFDTGLVDELLNYIDFGRFVQDAG